MMKVVKIGIIVGSGLEDPKILKDAKETEVETKFGKPSSPLIIGTIKGVDVVILSRHGKKHTIHPGKVNYRANIWALKEQGCTNIIASSACGSLREKIKPCDFIIVDQFIDRTHGRQSTFYDEDNVAHIPMAEPFCKDLRKALSETAKELYFNVHEKGTVVTIQGPRFSTKAESHLFRSWKADVINMSTVPECVLAREAGICYAVVCMSTDYDCFLEDRPAVNIQEVLKVFKNNAEKVTQLIIKVMPKIKDNPECYCRTDIKGAIIS